MLTIVFSEVVSVDRIVGDGDTGVGLSRIGRRGLSVETFDGRRWDSVRGCDLDLIRSLGRMPALDPRVETMIRRQHAVREVRNLDPLVTSFGSACKALRAAHPRDRIRSYDLVVHSRHVVAWRTDGPVRRATRTRVSLDLLRDRGTDGQLAPPERIEVPVRARRPLDSLDWLAMLRRARRAAVTMESPAPACDGGLREIDGSRLDVVFEGGLSGVALHEACGHSLEADVVEGGTPLSRLLGERVAPEFVTLTDDPTIDGGFGSMLFDDEGREALPTPLIVEGRLERCLSSARYPGVGNPETVCNGRRADYRSRAYPRMSNLELAAGRTTRSALLAGVRGRGLLVESLGIGGESNPHEGTFSLAVRRARLIEGGAPGRIVGPLILRGETVAFLRSIAGVGRRSRFRPFVTLCEKHGQRIFTDAVSPPMLVLGLAVRAYGPAADRG